MTGLSGVLLRQVPAELVGGVQSGEFEVLGSIIRSVSSGRIVGHLQETSLLSQLVSRAPLSLAGTVGDAITIVQNEQIKAALAVVQSLQMTNIVLSAAAIGASVAGTALVKRKLSLLESKIDALEPQLAQISKGIRALQHDRIAEDFARLDTLAVQLDECWSLANPEVEWRDIARDAHFLADNFGRRTRELQHEGADPLAAVPFIEAFAIASAARVTARLASDDKVAAREAAHSSAEVLIAFGSNIRLGPLILQRMLARDDQAATPLWTTGIEQAEDELRPIVISTREREMAAATTVATISHLQERQLSGRDWLAAAREETQSPLLFLPADD